MKYGHKIEMRIEGYDEKGRGLGQIEIVPGEMRDVVTPFTAQEDQIEAIFAKREYGLKICTLDKIVKAGPDRVKAPCPHAGVCGGCLWQHLDYPAQLKEKERGINELFGQLDLADKIKPILPAEETLGYRNRMDFCIGWNGEIGLKEYGSWNHYVDLKQCLLLKPGATEILQIMRDLMKQFDLQPWDAKFHKGDLRYVVIRDGQFTGKRLITLVIQDATRINQEARKFLCDKLKPFCTTLLLGELSKPTDVSLAESFETLFGDPWLEEKINETTYHIHPNSFFQTNSAMAARLQNEVLSRLNDRPASTLLDLYCGLGFFGIAAAKQNKNLEVHGYELDEEAIKLASQNARLNKVENQCQFSSGKAEELGWKNINAQSVIIDPPRSGLHPRVIKALLDDTGPLKPRTIVYVSCNYHRLKDELPAFLQKYEVTSIQPLDLFPQTPHVEVIVALNKLKTNS